VESRPAWARGLKRTVFDVSQPALYVAPRVGAWIETWENEPWEQPLFVAPRVGAWMKLFMT